MRCKKPVWMYVRDRLDGEYTLWKRNKDFPEFKPVWVSKKEDWGIFELLTSHRALTESKQKSNWISVFKDSTELKRILKKDFAELFARAVAEKLFENGRIPFLEITGKFLDVHGSFVAVELEIANLSSVPALIPLFEILTAPDTNTFSLKSINPSKTLRQNVRLTYLAGKSFSLQTSLSYCILEGHAFKDLGELFISLNASHFEIDYVLRKRCYIGVATQVLLDTNR